MHHGKCRLFQLVSQMDKTWEVVVDIAGKMNLLSFVEG